MQKNEFMKKYEKKTGKNAIWQGKITKQFKQWKKNQPKTVNKEPAVKKETPVIKKTCWW